MHGWVDAVPHWGVCVDAVYFYLSAAELSAVCGEFVCGERSVSQCVGGGVDFICAAVVYQFGDREWGQCVGGLVVWWCGGRVGALVLGGEFEEEEQVCNVLGRNKQAEDASRGC